QRFRFCGDLDCPDWVLAEIGALARVSSVKLKLICAQVLQDLLGDTIELSGAPLLASIPPAELGDVKATIAVLGIILSSAAKHNVDRESLSRELRQLELPKVLGGLGVRDSAPARRCHGTDTAPLPTLMSQLHSVCWQVDYTLSSSDLREDNKPLVHLTFNLRDGEYGKIATIPTALS
ncbi:COMD4 protein, partial [Atlantisia rogersi]|nr:COMD4 protein [Atlantisia rogersi]